MIIKSLFFTLLAKFSHYSSKKFAKRKFVSTNSHNVRKIVLETANISLQINKNTDNLAVFLATNNTNEHEVILPKVINTK